ncbi:hypothetical protein DFH11DRAFT_197390 [Phellopilus nigrolimitatus]|nr:hypothetical protein DFH11DRAFT_197390 [Phellopilus nigrolimitatus]
MSSDGPPSYESVVARFEQSLGSNPKPQDVLNAIDQLPQYEIDVLASNPYEMPVLTDEQKAAFTLGVAKTMTSPEAAEHLKNTATKASAACKAIETMFTKLTVELAKIDAKNIPPKEGPFVPRFELLHQDYLRTVHISKDFAVKMSVYGKEFDTVVIPFCNDKSISKEKRLAIITEFIKNADTFSKDSDGIMKSFDTLKSQFNTFVGSFSGWASEKEAADIKELKGLDEVLKKLKEELSNLNNELTKLTLIVVGVLPVTVLAVLVLGPVGLICGLIFAGISIAFFIECAIRIDSKNKEISFTRARIEALRKSISDIEETRVNLERLGDESLQLFNDNIKFIGMLWTHAHNDALEIKTWLEGSAKFADMPKYMETSLRETISIYKTMAVYLRQYADGIESVNIPKPTFR